MWHFHLMFSHCCWNAQTVNLAILPLLKYTSVDVLCFFLTWEKKHSVTVSMLKLQNPFCDNPFKINKGQIWTCSFPLIETSVVFVFFLFWEGGDIKKKLYIFLLLVIYIYIYKTLVWFNWKYCHPLFSILHNVSKSFFCDASNHRFVPQAGDCYWERIYCTYMRLCVHQEHFPPNQFLVLVVYSGNDTLMHVSHSTDSLSMI